MIWRYSTSVAIPRSLRIVGGQRSIAESLAHSAPEMAPHVRESQNLLSLIGASRGQSITLPVAMQVPAFAKALQTYTNTISAFPLKEYIGKDQTVARSFLVQPSKVTTYSSLMARTISDLLVYDEAYWKITARSWDGYPSEIMHMPFVQLSWSVSPSDPMQEVPEYGTLYWNGQVVPMGTYIRFDGTGAGGWLQYGATAINTAAALEQAALNAAMNPVPVTTLKNTGADLPGSQVDALLDAWEESRTQKSTAYLNSTIDLIVNGFSARDMQLVEARQASGAQIARMANLDPVWVGAGVPGSSLTYANRTDLYRQLLDLSLRPVMNMISQRLTMTDVTPRGHSVTFDTSVFLKESVGDMAQIVNTLLPLGVINLDEARDFIDLPDLMDVDIEGQD